MIVTGWQIERRRSLAGRRAAAALLWLWNARKMATHWSQARIAGTPTIRPDTPSQALLPPARHPSLGQGSRITSCASSRPLVNPVGPAPERETVTLINTSAHALNLGGWALLDRFKQRMSLDSITLPAGETVRIQLQPPIQLGNQGGLLTLLSPAGLKVDGVAYTRQQADAEVWTVVF